MIDLSRSFVAVIQPNEVQTISIDRGVFTFRTLGNVLFIADGSFRPDESQQSPGFMINEYPTECILKSGTLTIKNPSGVAQPLWIGPEYVG